MKKIIAFVSLIAALSMTASYFSCDSQAKGFSLSLQFSCLWWGPDQMGIDPNDAPPKTTETVIEKWEYSDPVGVPHPDSVMVMGSGEAFGYLVVERRFKEGPLAKSKLAKWEKWEPLTTTDGFKLTGKTKLAEVDVKQRMDALFAKDRWPHALEVRVSLYADKTKAKKLLSESKTLPIIPGD
jgi:hypothetical protein